MGQMHQSAMRHPEKAVLTASLLRRRGNITTDPASARERAARAALNEGVLFEKGAAQVWHSHPGGRARQPLELSGCIRLDLHLHGIDATALEKLLLALLPAKARAAV